MTVIVTSVRGALLAGLLAATAGLAQATAVAGGPGAGSSVGGSGSGSTPARRFVPAAAAAGADAPTLDLVNARIDAMDAQAGTITVRGKLLPLHPTHLRVVGPGGQALSGARALRPGMQVRFALEPEAHAGRAATPHGPQPAAGADAVPAARPIVLIYIDSQP